MAAHPGGADTAAHPLLDRTLGVLRVGYPYLPRLRRRWQAATAEIRLLGRRTTVVSGREGVRFFYDESALRRRGAIPRPLRRTLFGDGAVHGLDDDDHKHRKALFLDLLTPSAARAIAELGAACWRDRAGRPVDPVAVFGEAVQVHAAAVCEWARTGTPYDRLGADLATIVDGFGGLGPRHVAARRARHRAERWARTQVRSARERQTAGAGTALDAVATYRGRNGELLPERVAAVELLNVLRPTVAVAYFVAFAADALARRPELRERLGSGSAGDLEGFAHEVRRYYPFVPMLAARVRRSVRYAGRVLPPGRRVVLDVYGTLHDPQIWPDPERFDIDRFTGAEPDQDTFVPQGGGDGRTGHRCPGERVAVELIKAAARHLVDERAPGQEHGSIPLNRMPTRPLRRAAPRARRLGRR